MTKILNSSQFYSKVRTPNKLVVVDFFATWCKPCKMMMPIFQSLEKEMVRSVDFFKINVDKSSDVSHKYKISSIPTIIIFKNGKEVGRMVGFVPKEKLRGKIKSYL